MASPTTSLRKVLHVSGKESQAAVASFCRLFSKKDARLLHLSHSLVHGCLTLNAEFHAPGPEAESLVKAVESWANERELHLMVTDLPSETKGTASCGLWITVLGDLKAGDLLAPLIDCLQERGFSLNKIESIGDGDLTGVNLLALKETLSDEQFKEARRALLALSTELNVDLAVQKDDIYRSSKRLLCMDVDSTFVQGEFIDDLAEMMGVKDEVAAITARAMRGELDFEAALRERVKLLKGLPMSRARELCESFELTPGAGDLVRTAKRLGMRIGLVSGGFDFFVEALKEKFGLDFTFANELGVEDGKLTGEVVGTIVDSHRKAQVLKDMAHVFGIRLEQTIAAGDGANDIQMLQTAGLGIAYQAKPLLQEVADTRFNQNDRLDTLLYLMGFDAKKLAGACE